MANTANTPSNGTGSQKPDRQTTQQNRLTRQSCQLHGQITVRYDKHATPAFTTHTNSPSLLILLISLCPYIFL